MKDQSYYGKQGDFAVLEELAGVCKTSFHPHTAGPIKPRSVLGAVGPVLMVWGINAIAIVGSMSVRRHRLLTVALTDCAQLGALRVRFELEILKTETQAILPFVAWLACDAAVVKPDDCAVPLAFCAITRREVHYAISKAAISPSFDKKEFGRAVPLADWLSAWRQRAAAQHRAAAMGSNNLRLVTDE